jgi:aspartyl-tRNA(Asn)/glutamyl-tRNA(Gln) amidotransferase subunit C
VAVEINTSHVARLARLELSDDELDTYGRQCQELLEHVARIQAVDTRGVEPTSHPFPMTNRFRDDRVTPETVLDQEEVLAQAPDTEGPFFRVPPAIEEA